MAKFRKQESPKDDNEAKADEVAENPKDPKKKHSKAQCDEN